MAKSYNKKINAEKKKIEKKKKKKGILL